MKSLKEIRKQRLDLSSVLSACPKRCADGVPGLYCNMCAAAAAQEKLLAWVSDEKSIVEKFQEEQRSEFLKEQRSTP